MAITKIDVHTFLSLSVHTLVIDVRSEGEFEHAHFPGAVSMPLFNNEERKIVGTAYKQESKQQAIKIGLALFGKKMVSMVETVEAMLQKTNKSNSSNNKAVIVHCWRGGMRSGGVGWLLDLYGCKVYTLVGGYKAFRRWSIQQLEKDYDLQVIGGYTGSGKTLVLQELKRMNHAVIDLEELAKHKGSAFGNIGMPAQPSQEMFENLLAVELYNAVDSYKLTVDSCKMTDDGSEVTVDTTEITVDRCTMKDDGEEDCKPNSVNSSFPSTVNHQPSTLHPPSTYNLSAIWIEDESQRIGLVNIPSPFFKIMRSKTLYFLDIPFEERLSHIVNEYGTCENEELVKAVNRIQKRLGGHEAKTAINYISNNQVREGFAILLKYYDKLYLKGLSSRVPLPELFTRLHCDTVDAQKNALTIADTQTHNIHG